MAEQQRISPYSLADPDPEVYQPINGRKPPRSENFQQKSFFFKNRQNKPIFTHFFKKISPNIT